MIRPFEDKMPRIAATAFISEAAYIVGDVEIGEYSSVWPGAVIRADYARVTVGSYTHLEDNCTIHCGVPLSIGNNVIVGHGAVIHCGSIGSNVLVGNNATLLDGAEIGDLCIVGAGALVTPGTKVPEGSLVLGVPAQVVGRLSDSQMLRLRQGGKGYAEYAQKYKRLGL